MLSIYRLKSPHPGNARLVPFVLSRWDGYAIALVENRCYLFDYFVSLADLFSTLYLWTDCGRQLIICIWFRVEIVDSILSVPISFFHDIEFDRSPEASACQHFFLSDFRSEGTTRRSIYTSVLGHTLYSVSIWSRCSPPPSLSLSVSHRHSAIKFTALLKMRCLCFSRFRTIERVVAIWSIANCTSMNRSVQHDWVVFITCANEKTYSHASSLRYYCLWWPRRFDVNRLMSISGAVDWRSFEEERTSDYFGSVQALSAQTGVYIQYSKIFTFLSSMIVTGG